MRTYSTKVRVRLSLRIHRHVDQGVLLKHRAIEVAAAVLVFHAANRRRHASCGKSRHDGAQRQWLTGDCGRRCDRRRLLSRGSLSLGGGSLLLGGRGLLLGRGGLLLGRGGLLLGSGRLLLGGRRLLLSLRDLRRTRRLGCARYDDRGP